VSHPDARFLVRYGEADYLVDVKYVELIDESVIAVREAEARDEAAGRIEMEVRPGVSVPAEAPFADTAYRRVAVEIADAVQHQPPICTDGQTMRIATDANNEARTLYREARQAWVVFALCPAGSAGQPG